MARLVNPHLGTDTEGGWAMGFSWGFVGPAVSQDPPLVIAPEQMDAFNEGVLAGQQTAIDGLPVEPACVSLAQEVSSTAEAFVKDVHYFEIIGLVKAIKHFAHFSAEAFVFAFTLMIPGPPPLNPITAFLTLGGNIRDRLAELGLARNSLFLSVGIDENVAGCELQFTPIFTQLDSTRAAVQNLGRAQWVIARWDADAPMSGSQFNIIESSPE
jgi:hypothetical protein